MVFVSTHYGQHNDDCFACKIKSVNLDPGGPKTHVKKGDPWKDNPVQDRIEELAAQGRKIARMELKQDHQPDTSKES